MGTVEEFGKWATGNIADALRAMGYTVVMDHEIHPIFTPIKLVGRAMTMRAERTKRKSDQADVSTIAKENCRKGDVVILDCKGYENGDSVLWGENSMTACQMRGAVGAIIDGGCRDSARLRDLQIPVYARALSPGGTRPLYVIDYNTPVLCGGIRVEPGDLVVGDDDGICVIPREIEEEALKIVQIYGQRDQAVSPALRSGKTVVEAYSIKRGWEKEAGLKK